MAYDDWQPPQGEDPAVAEGWERIEKLVSQPVYSRAKETYAAMREMGVDPELALTLPASVYGMIRQGDDAPIYLHFVNELGFDFTTTVTWLKECGLDVDAAFAWALLGAAYEVDNLELYKVIQSDMKLAPLVRQLRKCTGWGISLEIIRNDIDPSMVDSLIDG